MKSPCLINARKSAMVAGAGVFQSAAPYAGATGMEVTEFDLEPDSYHTANFNAGLVCGQREIMVFIKNIGDENALLSFDRERGGRGRLGYRVSEPRSFGLTARYEF
ncbi:hypothetical protein [Marinobacter salarius]|uniref:hypothetical protein n=1 Tax=Marinobacter salarius TaxID=1420917 RepID=UPI0032EDCF06